MKRAIAALLLAVCAFAVHAQQDESLPVGGRRVKSRKGRAVGPHAFDCEQWDRRAEPQTVPALDRHHHQIPIAEEIQFPPVGAPRRLCAAARADALFLAQIGVACDVDIKRSRFVRHPRDPAAVG